METGIDVRDTQEQGTPYNGSGCLIHGLSIIADSFVVVETLLIKHPDVQRMGVTGQMHGIVYLDDAGNPVSPLYTWQDSRGDPFL